MDYKETTKRDLAHRIILKCLFKKVCVAVDYKETTKRDLAQRIILKCLFKNRLCSIGLNSTDLLGF